MPTSTIQRSFSGGEIAPALFARADQAKYQSGLKTCRNFMVMRHGGVTNRPGSRFIAEVKDSSQAVRLIKFVFNADQTYVLEFGHQYMRVIRDGVQLEDGGSPYEIATPYEEEHLPDLQYVQSGDVVTIAHPSYAPRELKRTGHTAWTLTVVDFKPSIDRPANGAYVAGGGSGSSSHRYRVTAVAEETFEESLPCFEATKTITGATQANPVELTVASHGYKTGDEVYIDGIAGMTELNGRAFIITDTGANTFTLDDEDGTGHTAYVSGGTAARTYIRVDDVLGNPALAAAPGLQISWDKVPGAIEYHVYRHTGGDFGFIGTADSNEFADAIAPADVDTSQTPPLDRNPFEEAGDYPSTVAYTQQRLTFGATTNDPEKVWLSQTGNFHNFTRHRPLQDDDAITFTVAGRQVNEIRHLLELGRLVILTSGGEWLAAGGDAGILLPTTINLKQQGYYGSSKLRPITIGGNALYVQSRGAVVRDLRFSLEVDGYTGNDLTVFAAHLFDDWTIADWDYAQIPHSVAWAVRSDGMLLGLTYIFEHQVWGWHRHDTDGLYENVAVVPEGREDATYVVVNRTIDGQTKRYIERFASRRFDTIDDAFFVDSGLSFDGRNADAGHTMTLTGGSTWSYDESLTLTSSEAFFVAGDVGNEIHLTVGADEVRCRITAFTSDTVVTVQTNKDVPAAFQTVAISDWAKAVDEVSGLDHLEGKTVSILADGNVEPQQVVSGGAIALQRPYAVIHAGLPIQADLETLSIENTGGETLTDKRKLVNEVSLMVEGSRGIWVGPDADHLTEYKQREDEGWDEPIGMDTGTVKVSIEARWDDNGRVFVRQDDPLPLAVLAIIPSGVVSSGR